VHDDDEAERRCHLTSDEAAVDCSHHPRDHFIEDLVERRRGLEVKDLSGLGHGGNTSLDVVLEGLVAYVAERRIALESAPDAFGEL
jgi:hypothetical protein